MSETSDSEHISPPGILKKSWSVMKSAEMDDSLLQRPLHVKPFNLRFAPKRDLGRSYVSLVKPLGLEATVTPKFYTKHYKGETEVSEEHVDRVNAKIDHQFKTGPREKYQDPYLSSHVYGWWWDKGEAIPKDRKLNHRIQDSYWLKSRIAILAADQKLKYSK